MRALCADLVAGAAAALLTIASLAGCPSSSPPPTPATPIVDDDGLSTMAVSTRGALLWQRGPALARGLSQALLVPVEDLCRELGRFDCVDFAHQVPLGGNDAFVKGQYEPLLEPGATTAVAFDRLALSACSVAVELERTRVGAFIFRGHALTDEPLDPSATDTIEGARFLGTELYRRLHAREPREAELVELNALLTDDEGRGISGLDFAKLSCFAVASTTETLFF
jgi:hypothetical protein